jgi:hypothetical protein
LQVIEHKALSDALASVRDDGGAYTQSPLWRADDTDSLGDNDFEQHTPQENTFEDSVVSHYENYDTIGISLLLQHLPNCHYFPTLYPSTPRSPIADWIRDAMLDRRQRIAFDKQVILHRDE